MESEPAKHSSHRGWQSKTNESLRILHKAGPHKKSRLIIIILSYPN